MANEKTVFNEIYAAVTDFLGIRPRDMVDYSEEFKLTAGTLTSLRTRGTLSEDYFESIRKSIKNILNENEYKVKLCGKQPSDLMEILAPIWQKYSVPAVQWRENKSTVDNLLDIISAAYAASRMNKGKRKTADAAKTEKPKRVIAFDLDGTLLKGFRYSWTLIFEAIGSTGKEAVKLIDDFEWGRITYQEWCRSDCEILRKGGLTFEKVKRAVEKSKARLTNNLRQAIRKLKDNGCKVVIISGGADSVLYALLPDADQLFDEIFINKLIYNKETGILEEIIPTKYDWDEYGNGVEGKRAGLVRLCERYGAKPKDSVFVGNDYNDVGAMAVAGMKILYYSYSEEDPARGWSSRPEIRTFPADMIFEPGDDLMRVADRIIAWKFGDLSSSDLK